MSETKKLFLLDGFALIFRSHFAFSNNPRINSKGLNTGVIYGFTNTLLDVINKQKPSHIAVVFDTSAPTFRHEEYKEYKANRQETPEDIKIGTPIVKQLVRGFGIPVIELDGYEADDLIGTLAKKAARKGFEVYMMTPDKDFGQLVEESIFLFKPSYMGNGVDIMGPEEIKAKWDISDVDQVRDILGLQGDSSDNIPGIPGIGPKTAAKLLNEFGTVENIIANADKLKGKQKERVIEFAEQGILSKRLATIVIDAPVEFEEEKFVYTGPQKEDLVPLFQDLEFRTTLKRIFPDEGTPSVAPAAQLDMFSAAATSQKPIKTNKPNDSDSAIEEENTALARTSFKDMSFRYFECSSKEEIEDLNHYLGLQQSFTIEFIANDTNPINAAPLMIGFHYSDSDVHYITFQEEDDQWKWDILKPALENPEIEKCGHQLKYLMVFLFKKGISLNGNLIDIMLAHYLIDPDLSHQLDRIADQYLNHDMLEGYGKILDKSKFNAKISTQHELNLIDVLTESVLITSKLVPPIKEALLKDPIKHLYFEIEMPLMKVLAEMEVAGVSIEAQTLFAMSEEVGQICDQLQKQIFTEAGEEFNVNSPKQLGDILFEKMKLIDKPKKTKSGQYATGEEILRALENDYPIVGNILEYRELQKLKSTYIDALPNMISTWDNKIHTNYSQAVAATGRLSSINPNLQNIPVRTERGKLIRKAFVSSDPQFELFSADYSQIELRIMASFSEDPTMLEAFKQGKDIHAATAAKIFNVDLEEVDGPMRRKAKSVNFGLIYGQSAFGLAQNLSISRTEAKEIIDAYFTEFSSVKKYMDEVINQARENEYVETILGRRRYLRDINSKNQTMRGFAERNAINAPIQGSAADIIKMAMIHVQKELSKGSFKSKMIMQVHDELVFELHKDEKEEVIKIVIDKMQNAVALKVPMVVDYGVGKNWLEAH